MRKILGPLCRREDQGAPAVGDEAAHQLGEGPGDHVGVHDVVDGDRIAIAGAWILGRPFTLDDGHGRHVFRSQAIGLQIAEDRDGEHGGRAHRPVWHFELAGEARRRAREAARADARAPAFAVSDQHGLAEAGIDRRGGVTDMQHKGAAADTRAVRIGGRNSHIVGQVGWADPGAGDAVDVLWSQSGVRHRIERGVRMEADNGNIRDAAHLGGFGGADHGNGFLFHGIRLPQVQRRGARCRRSGPRRSP